MKEAPLQPDEARRLQALYDYHILDTEPETAFNELADLAAEICEAPIALVTLVDESRQWFKARLGLSVEETSRSVAFCAHAILQSEVFVVPDTLADARFSDNPLVSGPPNIRFYAGAPLINRDGFALGTLCVIDTTPRELTPKQEKALRVLRRHVLNLMEMRRQNIELKRLNDELEAFSGAVSHDLVSPLRRIAGFVGVLLAEAENRLSSGALHAVRRIEHSVQQMEQVVHGLLLLSRVTRGELRYTRVDMSEISNDILVELQQSHPDRVVNVEVAADMTVLGDPRLIRLALENLLNNAWKFTAERKPARISVGSCTSDGRRVFYVEDNGAGFDMTQAGRLFVPFQRLHTEQQFGGVGIGLATVRRIIERHGGEIWCKGAVDEGATFLFTCGADKAA